MPPPPTTAARRRTRAAAGAASPPPSPRATSPRRKAAAESKKAQPPALSFSTLPPVARKRLLIAAGVTLALAALSYTLWLQNAALKAAILPLLDELSASAESAELLAGLSALSARLPSALGGSAPARRRPGVEARAAGLRPAHPVLLIPGFVTSALELWAGPPCAGRSGFRTRWWGGLGMTARLVADRACWMEAMALDPETGLDPVIEKDGNVTHTVRVRAVAGKGRERERTESACAACPPALMERRALTFWHFTHTHTHTHTFLPLSF